MKTTKSQWWFSGPDRSERCSAEEQISLCVSSTFINLTDRLSDGLNKPEGSRRQPANGRKVSKTEGPLSDRRHPVVAPTPPPGERRAAAGSAFLGSGDIMNCGVRIVQAGRRRNGKCSSAGLVEAQHPHGSGIIRQQPETPESLTQTCIYTQGSSASLPGRKDHVDLKKKQLKNKVQHLSLLPRKKKDRFSQVGSA